MKRLPRWVPVVLVLAVFLALAFYAIGPSKPPEAQPVIPYTEFKSLLARGEIAEVTLKGDSATGTLKRALPLGPEDREAESFRTRVPAFGDRELMRPCRRRSFPAEHGPAAAEKLLLESLSSGADDDIRQATAPARARGGRSSGSHPPVKLNPPFRRS